MNQYKNCEKIENSIYRDYIVFLKETVHIVNENLTKYNFEKLKENEKYKMYFGSYQFGFCRFGLEQKDNNKRCCPFYSIPTSLTHFENRKIFIFNKYNSYEIDKLPFCKNHGRCELIDIERQLKIVNDNDFENFINDKKIDEAKDLLIKLSIKKIRQTLIDFRTKV